MNKLMILVTALMLGLFIYGLCEAHDTHLSDIGEQTNITIGPCPSLSGYIVSSDQRECYLIYKQVALDHQGMHVQDIDLNKDGECTCPTMKGTD